MGFWRLCHGKYRALDKVRYPFTCLYSKQCMVTDLPTKGWSQEDEGKGEAPTLSRFVLKAALPQEIGDHEEKSKGAASPLSKGSDKGLNVDRRRLAAVAGYSRVDHLRII